jgi:hypothetical protein
MSSGSSSSDNPDEDEDDVSTWNPEGDKVAEGDEVPIPFVYTPGGYNSAEEEEELLHSQDERMSSPPLMLPAVFPPQMPIPSPISSPLISPASSKKKKAGRPDSGRTPKKKKNKKREARFQYCLGDTFKATADSLKVVIRGRPVTWKRPGESISGTRYTASQADANDFAGALKDACRMNKKTIEKWEKTCELEASFAFALPKKGAIVQPPDLDNLTKLVKDAM